MNENRYMHHRPILKERRRKLRREMTEAEQMLWNFLRMNSLRGMNFRRQHSIGPYIVDFYCYKYNLAIELDGFGHLKDDQAEYDKQRTEYFKQHDVRVVRFWNWEVLVKLPEVLKKIEKEGSLHPTHNSQREPK